MRTSELQGAALDWAVARCEDAWVRDGVDDDCPEYSTDWAAGGPIIERERINISDDGGEGWKADDSIGHWGYGSTPLVAAMRCYVASKLGDNIDLPEEL